MRPTRPFDPARSALIAVDMQRKFTDSTEGMRANTVSRLDAVNRAIAAFRDAGRPIVYVGYCGRCEFAPEVSDEDAFTYGMLPPRGEDIVYGKDNMNSFHRSDFAEMLRGIGCTDVLIPGCVAHFCVLATYFGAWDAGFEPYVLKGGIAAKDADCISAVETIVRSMDVDEVEALLRGHRFCPRSRRSIFIL